jgi:hypothetical protein
MKTSGSNTYSAFKNARATLERSARSHIDKIHSSERRLQTIVEKQAQLFARLSSIHINANLELPASVRSSMDRRHANIEETRKEVERIKDSLSALKRERAVAETERAEVEERLAREHAAISARFEQDARVVELRRRMADLAQAHGSLDEKMRTAQTELALKRVAYEQDRFFGYLRKVGYGTLSYTAWLPLVRQFDSRLAKITNFAEENANFERLIAAPSWFSDRIATIAPEEAKANSEFSALESEYFGVLAPQREEFAAKTEKVRVADERIEVKNSDIYAANQFLSNAALAEDSEIKKISRDLAEILKRTGFYDLKRLAAQTTGTEDDAIVAELQTLTDEATALSKVVTAEQEQLYSLERKIKAFEEIENHLRRKRWNDSDHGFRNIDADRLSHQLSHDAVSSGVIIGMLNSSHVEPVRESYSSSGGSYYGGSSSRGSSSSSSNDSYSTGSSFGGSDSYSTTDSF